MDEAEVRARHRDHTTCSAMRWRIRGSVIDAVGEMGTKDRILVPRVAAMGSDTSPWIRHNVIEALGVLGNVGDEVTTILGQASGDEDYLVGHNTALALCDLGTASGVAIDMLLKVSAHAELYRRKDALMALEVLFG